MWIFKYLRNSRFITLFAFHLICLLIILINFPHGKYFIGWDAVNPEFNLSLNINRSLFASWQENYGLGTMAGHGFAALFPHNLIISFLSFIFPMWSIRSIFTFLCFYLGGLGMYYLFNLIIRKVNEKYKLIQTSYIDYIALSSAFFYILNFATIQMFYLQLEPFIVHFAFLPWLFWITIKLFDGITKKNLLLFFIINFFASIQGFIPQLFVGYFIALCILLVVFLLHSKIAFSAIKRVGVIIFMTLIINAFWILPLTYYYPNKGSITTNAYNNLIATDDFIEKNKKYGNLTNVALLKGFYIDMKDSTGDILQPWLIHENITVKMIGFSFFLLAFIGFILSVFVIQSLLVRGIGIIALYYFGSLAIDTLPFSLFNQIIHFLFPLYHQAFRAPFTKFSLSVGFVYSLLIGVAIFYFIYYINIKKRFSHKFFLYLLFPTFIGFLLYYSYPVFGGNLFYKKLVLNIPTGNLQVIEFFKNQDNGRIADLPQGCPEGWFNYNWGYVGSGFYWYGIKQPILSRTFDVWSQNNENYYWEVTKAIKSNNYTQVDSILQKYDVRWILYDPNIIHCRNVKGLIGNDELIKHFEESSKYKMVGNFDSQTLYPIQIFENLDARSSEYISLQKNLKNVNPQYSWNSEDKAYLELGSYVSDMSILTDAYYPFRSLFTGRRQEELEFGFEDIRLRQNFGGKEGNYFSFIAKIPKELGGYTLLIPPTMKEEVMEIDAYDLDKTVDKYPEVLLDGQEIHPGGVMAFTSLQTITLGRLSQDALLEVRVPKLGGYYSSVIKPFSYSMVPKNCNQFSKGLFSHEKISENGKEWLRLTSIGSGNCLDFDLPQLSQRMSYLVSIDSRNIEGKSLLFAIINKNFQRADIETYLPKSKVDTSYFVIPPMEYYGVGYNIHLDNTSIGRDRTVNDLGAITVNPIPYNFLTGLKIVKSDFIYDRESQVTIIPEKVEHSNPSYYEVGIDNETMKQCNNERCTLVLSQSFDKAWRAYALKNDSLLLDSWYMKLMIPLFGKGLKEHVLVNNWENGWGVSNATMKQCNNETEKCTIAIIYLPQYLEYAGFGMLGVFLTYLLIKRKRAD